MDEPESLKGQEAGQQAEAVGGEEAVLGRGGAAGTKVA